MGSVGRHDTVPSSVSGKFSEGTSWLGLTTSSYKYSLQDNYDVLGLTGQGGFGNVFLAQHRGTCMPVAMKELMKTEEQVACIMTEVAILKDVRHSKITQLLEVIQTKDKVHLVLEYVMGLNLGQEIFQTERQRLQEKDVQRIFRDILGAVHYRHQQCIVHGDLKPENVLIDTQGRAKVCDFGFGFWFLPGQKVTAPGGTPGYFASERILYEMYEGPPLDIWALGVILHEMINRTRLFCGEPSKVTENIIYEMVSYPDFFSMDTKNFIGNLRNRDPSMRPTAQKVLEHQWLQGVRPPSPPEPLPVPTKRAILSIWLGWISTH
ncbi:sperm motility kinase 2B-like [Fukomys damarensis]|uniref:sperm motility kinase 2B-like n=1 Tax=Fukomys damarensis TaxID=885580 RepID=UPI00053FC621|nr:sperm motility kinase 2B-like [Fukomys damarensis]